MPELNNAEGAIAVSTRDHELARLRAALDAVPDDVLAREHAEKVAEMARLRADVRAARAATASAGDGATPAPSYKARLVRLLRDPRRLGSALEYRARRAVGVASSVPQAIAREGGIRPTARKTLGLVLRDGPRGARVLYPVTVPAPRVPQAAPQPVDPSWYSTDAPEVSIVVLNWNRSDVTLDCLRSLWAHTSGHRYEIVLVDNGSRPADVAAFDSLDGPCTVVRLEVNRYFGEGNNIGVERAQAPLVVLMNNDVTVTPGWLEPLVEAVLGSDDCGAAGPKFVYPNGLLQEAGGLLDEEANSVQIGKFQDPDAPEFNRGRQVDYVSAACCLLRKEDFLRVLGFDLQYEPAYYEDADLCLKLSQLGLTTRYVPESRVVHHESVTTSDSSHGLELSSISEINRIKFLRHWGDYLRSGRHAAAPERVPVVACAPVAGRRTLGLYSPFELTPGGGERYLLTLAMAGLQRGLSVHLVTPAPYSQVRLSSLAAMFGLDLDGLCVTSLAEAERLAPFDEWLAMSNQIVPPTRARGKRSSLICQFPFRAGLKEWRSRIALLADYEQVVVYSEFTAAAVRQRLQEAHVPAIPITILSPPVPVTEEPIRDHKAGIVSTGRFFAGDHSKRQDLQIEAFRRLAGMGLGDDLVLHLVGSSATDPRHRKFLADCMKAAEGLNIEFHVNASLAKVTELYASSSLYWHSSGLGVDVHEEPERCEHFGITPVEAMAHGTIPLVVNNGGPAATVRDGVDGYHYRTVEELAERTADVLGRTESERRPMREAARARAQEFSEAAFLDAAASLLEL